MRKRLIDHVGMHLESGSLPLPIESIAQVEVSSEAAGSPIEAAGTPGASGRIPCSFQGEIAIHQARQRIVIGVDRTPSPQAKGILLCANNIGVHPTIVNR